MERPCQKYIRFKNGTFQYYDKSKEENIEIPLPIRFVKIDELSTISGYHEPSNSGIYSNEVHSTQKETLNVRAFKGGDIAKGFYADIKDKVKSHGGKYTKSIYALFQGELVNFQLSGAAFGGWIEADTRGNTFEVTELKDGQKGATKFKVPVFVPVADDQKEIAQAMELDKTLQAFLADYKLQQQEVVEDDDEQESDAPQPKIVEGDKKPDNKAQNIPDIKYESDVKPEDLPF